jgi:hypothetical protein
MAAKRKRITYKEGIAQELILDSDLDTHTSEDEISLTKKRQRQTTHSLDHVYLLPTGLKGVPVGKEKVVPVLKYHPMKIYLLLY